MLSPPIRLEDRLRSLAAQWTAAHEPSATLSRLGTLAVRDSSFFTWLGKAIKGPSTSKLEAFARFFVDPASWPNGAVPEEAVVFAHAVGVSAPAAAPSAGNTAALSPCKRAAA